MRKYTATIVAIIIFPLFDWLYAWVFQTNGIQKQLGITSLFVVFLGIPLISLVVSTIVTQNITVKRLVVQYLRMVLVYFMGILCLSADADIYISITNKNFILIGSIWVIFTLGVGSLIGLLFPLIGIEQEGVLNAFHIAVLMIRRAWYLVLPGTLLTVAIQAVGIWIPHTEFEQGSGYLSIPMIWILYYIWISDAIRNKVGYI